jgi:hypothetical protein
MGYQQSTPGLAYPGVERFTMADAWKYRSGHLINCAAWGRNNSSGVKCSNGCRLRHYYRWLRLRYQTPQDPDYCPPEQLEELDV